MIYAIEIVVKIPIRDPVYSINCFVYSPTVNLVGLIWIAMAQIRSQTLF